MELLLVGAFLFFTGVTYNVVIGDLDNAIFGFIIVALMVITYLYFWNQRRKAEAFLKWVIRNKNQILTQGMVYDGIRIESDTQITQFQACVSFLVFTFKFPSQFYIRDYHFTGVIGLFFSLFSFVFGWWGIPWGPIYTFQVIVSNMRGGKKITVNDIQLNTIGTKEVFKTGHSL